MAEHLTFGQLARVLEDRARDSAKATERMHKTLERIGDTVVNQAQRNLGHYHRATGPIPAWEKLAESTIEDRVRQGYEPDEPLMRSRELWRSIDKNVTEASPRHGKVEIGSNLEYAKHLELGTSKMPPRPYLSLALWQKRDQVIRAAGAMAMEAFSASGEEMTDEMYQAHIAKAMLRAAESDGEGE